MVEGNDSKEENISEENGKSEIMEWIKSIGLAIVIALLIKTFVFNTTYVLGNSMLPTLHEKDRLIANIVPLYFSGPKHGDIVLLDAPDVENKKYIKRVIGLPGDQVDIIDGKVYLNGEELEENYIEDGSYTHAYDINSWKVEEGYVFVLGDNRLEGQSKDSRYFGPVDKKTLKGITKYRYFPFDSRIGSIDKKD